MFDAARYSRADRVLFERSGALRPSPADPALRILSRLADHIDAAAARQGEPQHLAEHLVVIGDHDSYGRVHLVEVVQMGCQAGARSSRHARTPSEWCGPVSRSTREARNGGIDGPAAVQRRSELDRPAAPLPSSAMCLRTSAARHTANS